ncbi:MULTISPECIES: sulfatase [Hungatella]|uniref:DUF4976 domain-containing protein n=1 Tax=Hungatella hathewayi TaxID=154046 RepID=A0A3E4U0R4_9FIRM|nr:MULTISPECIES: sulfatase [Hungatella]RGL99133.1 DUF4976 domain-containing protein [Hungatella hathewayi]RHM71408.1 DUF4976 domain-containing protein [Hungatella hathewayi]
MTARKPNIVFFIADQLRHSALGCYGNMVVKTPNIDGIAAEGVVMEQAFSSCPICSPYRGQLLSGQYAHQNGVICNEYKLRTDIPTLPECLKKAGYSTAYIGKWHLGYGPYPEEKRYGFDYMAAYNIDDDKSTSCVPYFENDEGPKAMSDWEPVEEANMTIHYLENHIKMSPERPLFLVVSRIPPHWPYEFCPEEYQIYNPEDIQVPPNVPKAMEEFEKKELALYYANVTGVDTQFGRIVNKLNELGMRDNTIVCFTSDHGDHIGAHGYGKPGDLWLHHTKRASKATPYEESVHIPFVMRYPDKIFGGNRSSILFNSVDVMPSLLAMCGIDIPDSVTGNDLSHAFTGQKGADPDSVFFQILGQGWPARGPWVGYWRGIRTDRYVYARWWKKEMPSLLFDIQKDPYELENLYYNQAYTDIRERMENRLQQWLRDTNDPFDYGKRDPKTGILLLGQEYLELAEYNVLKSGGGISIYEEGR